MKDLFGGVADINHTVTSKYVKLKYEKTLIHVADVWVLEVKNGWFAWAKTVQQRRNSCS